MVLFPTSIIGSYPRPKWLQDKMAEFAAKKISEQEMQSAFDKACIETIREHEEAGVEILSDGEMRRTEMTEYFAERIKGFTAYGPVRVWGNNYYNKPAIISELDYSQSLLVEEFKFIKANTSRGIKVPITGPYTIIDWSFDEHYKDKQEAVMKLAKIENEELKALVNAGASFIQIDEPAFSTRPEEIDFAVEAIKEMVRGVDAKLAIHICYGEYDKIYPALLDFPVDQFTLEFANRSFRVDYLKEHEFTKELGFGCIDVHNKNVESVDQIVAGLKKGLEIVPPEKLFVNPDCGLKMISRDVAKQKLSNMCQAAKKLRKEHGE
ncbi:methionine synthase [Candidatus Micrarchaeota archaeon]|nr:methionine synthase [Candidatus Micrarchaeota archaeon]